jgi:hypothetical protein
MARLKLITIERAKAKLSAIQLCFCKLLAGFSAFYLPRQRSVCYRSGCRRPRLRTLTAIAVLGGLVLAGCQGVTAPSAIDPARRSLGQASIKVVGEKLQSDWGKVPAPLSRTYYLSGEYNGKAAETLMGVSRAMGFGLWVQDQAAGAIDLSLTPKPGESLLSLLADINRQLKPQGAAVGVDVLNRVLVLSGGRK